MGGWTRQQKGLDVCRGWSPAHPDRPVYSDHAEKPAEPISGTETRSCHPRMIGQGRLEGRAMSIDDGIAIALWQVAQECESSDSAPRGRCLQNVLGSDLSEAAITALKRLIDAEGADELLRLLVRSVLSSYLLRLTVAVDEQRRFESGVLELGLCSGTAGQVAARSSGSLHESLMSVLLSHGVEL
jgi:hypothetical protein